MTKPIDRIGAFDDDHNLLNVVIDTPCGSRNKYRYDPATGMFTLRRVLPVGAVFPFDFGFVPSTRGEDGDPIDCLVLMDAPGFVGCLVRARLIGVLEARHHCASGTVRNDRLLAIADPAHTWSEVYAIEALSPGLLGEIERFFVGYNAAEGKKFEVLRRGGPERARELLQ